MILGRKKIDWSKHKEAIVSRLGRWFLIDFTQMDELLGTSVKKIWVYEGDRLIGEMPFSRARARFLEKYYPVIDNTKNLPYPEHFIKIPRKAVVLGRLNLVDLLV